MKKTYNIDGFTIVLNNNNWQVLGSDKTIIREGKTESTDYLEVYYTFLKEWACEMFSFNFEKGCMNDYLMNYCKENNIDFRYEYQILKADILDMNLYTRFYIVPHNGKQIVFA